jgi:conjugative relaxase-like TrwC/TraI family protein
MGLFMLTVAKVTGSAAVGYGEYLEGKTTAPELGDYYLKDGERVEAPGRWISGHTAVGSDGGVVTGEQLRDLMSVKYPGTDRPLRAVGATGQAVAALDATFSAPKSVSAVWALADQELRAAIERAHEDAASQAIAYSLSQVSMVRRRVSPTTVVHERASDLVATSWRHTTARAVEDHLPDPQLHSHVLLHAAVRADGKVVAIDSRAWMIHRRELGAAYRTELARGMAELGFDIRRGTGRGDRYFEINGIPQELLDRWSGRGRQIEEAIQQRLLQRDGTTADSGTRWDVIGPAEDRRLRVMTRAGKQPVTTRDLDRDWRHTAHEVGFGADHVSGLRQSKRPAPTVVETGELVKALTEFDATFTDREARAVTLERSAGAPTNDALSALRRAREQDHVLELADGRFTTRLHRATERSVVATTRQLAETTPSPIHPVAITAAARFVNERLAEHGGELSVEQVEALRTATGERQVVMIEGQAGTGKSTVLQAVALAHQAAGRQVLVTSTGALAAKRVADDLYDIGVNAPSFSTVALDRAIQDGGIALGPDVTIIHDEAALASTREQLRLHEAAEQSGARLVIVGDPKQSQPVGAGGLWPHLEQIASDSAARVELTQNLRAQKPEDRRDQKLFRDGQTVEALQGYGSRHRVHAAPNRRDAEQAALRAADTDRRAGLETLVIAQTSNDDLDELNARAQTLRAQAGELGTEQVPVPGRPYALHAGDQVQVRRSIQLSEHGQLRNGTTATIGRVDPDTQTVTLRIGDNEITLDREQVADTDVRLAYVQHPFPAQGATTDTTHLIAGEHATRDGTYVAITRARQETHIYTGSEHLAGDAGGQLANLAEHLSRDEPDIPSINFPLAPTARKRFTQCWERRAESVQPERQAQEIERDDLGWEL